MLRTFWKLGGGPCRSTTTARLIRVCCRCLLHLHVKQASHGWPGPSPHHGGGWSWPASWPCVAMEMSPAADSSHCPCVHPIPTEHQRVLPQHLCRPSPGPHLQGEGTPSAAAVPHSPPAADSFASRPVVTHFAGHQHGGAADARVLLHQPGLLLVLCNRRSAALLLAGGPQAHTTSLPAPSPLRHCS